MKYKHKNIVLHYALVCLAHVFYGLGFGAQFWGIKAGLSLVATISIFSFGMVFYFVTIFTSAEKVKKILFEKEEPKFDFEDEKKNDQLSEHP